MKIDEQTDVEIETNKNRFGKLNKKYFQKSKIKMNCLFMQ